MPGSAYLHGDRLTLNTMKSDDHAFIQRHWNDPRIRQWFPKSVPLDDSRMDDLLDPTEQSVAFLPCADGTPVGFVWLFRIDDIHRRASIGYWICPDKQENGYATEAVELGLQYGFNERGLNKVVARVFEANVPSRRVLEKLGFEQEGQLSQHYFVGGGFKNTILFGILADRFTEINDD